MTQEVADTWIEHERSSINFKRERSECLEPKDFLIKETNITETEVHASQCQDWEIQS